MDTPGMAKPKCNWITLDGTRCKNPATHGARCGRSDHQGPQKNTPGAQRSTRTPAQRRVQVAPAPTYGQPPPGRPATTTFRQQPTMPSPPSQKERERVEKTAQICADLIANGWQDTVADQIAAYAPTTWVRLRRSNHRRTCKALARMASFVLRTKTLIHKGVGKLFGMLVGGLGAGDAARAFAEELASNIPLPTDVKMIAVARGLQVTGIVLCLMDGKTLDQCDCFIDLVRAETGERVKQILSAGMSDWVDLARFQPSGTQASR